MCLFCRVKDLLEQMELSALFNKLNIYEAILNDFDRLWILLGSGILNSPTYKPYHCLI